MLKIATLVLFITSISFAKGPCHADKEKLCKEAEGDKAKMFQCMKDNADKVSAECKEHQAKIASELAELSSACKEDIQKHCADVEPGDKRIMKCLKKNKNEVSETCKAELKETKKDLKKFKKEYKKEDQS